MSFKGLTGFLLFCLLSFLNVNGVNADTTTIFVSDTITYQGRIQTEVPVYINNIDQNIEGFDLLFTIVPNDRAYFSTDHFEVIIDTVCSGLNSPCHPDSIIRVDTIISRIMKIDTTNSLTNDFSILDAHGEVGDTSSSYCIMMNVLGLAPAGGALEPGFGLLFKIYFDVLCLPDSVFLDTLVYVNVYGSLAQGDTLIRDKMFLPGRLIILGGFKYGDANGDDDISIADVVYMINFLFKGGPSPNPLVRGDASGNGELSVSDVVYLINYLFKGGPSPHCFSE